MSEPATYRHWHVIRTVCLNAAARDVWEVVGGFFTIHTWHPDIDRTEILTDATSTHALRRRLFFPGQAPTIEELVMLDEAAYHYRYRWHAGPWGEEVRHYRASLRVLAGDLDRSCVVQWESTFEHPQDAISNFYLHGFDALKKRFGACS